MKKLILYSLLLIFSCSGEEVNKVETDLEKEGLKGNVKTVKLHSYDAIEMFGEAVADTNKIRTIDFIEYNKSGFIKNRERTTYYNGIGYNQKLTFKYDSNNLVIEDEFYGYTTDEGGDYKFLSRDNYEYDSSNKLIYSYSVDNDNDKTIKSYTYNDEGKLIEENFNSTKSILGEDEIGDLIHKRIYSYKENKEIVEKYKGDGTFESAFVHYFEDGELTELHLYEDNKEELVSVAYFRDKMQYKYDFYYEGVLSSNYKSEYLDNDINGNYTKKIRYRKDAEEKTFKPESISLWKIEYY
jgi:hypothetical protein